MNFPFVLPCSINKAYLRVCLWYLSLFCHLFSFCTNPIWRDLPASGSASQQVSPLSSRFGIWPGPFLCPGLNGAEGLFQRTRWGMVYMEQICLLFYVACCVLFLPDKPVLPTRTEQKNCNNLCLPESLYPLYAACFFKGL